MKENTPLLYISIVAIVALIAIVILIMDYNAPIIPDTVEVDEDGNVAGQATKYRNPALAVTKVKPKLMVVKLFEYNCEDGIDNDGDNITDCADKRCMNTTYCLEQANNTTNTSDVVTEKEQSCIDSGGELAKMLCYCSSPTDYPNTCMVGVCTCPPLPEYERELKACFCPENKCFDGNECVKMPY